MEDKYAKSLLMKLLNDQLSEAETIELNQKMLESPLLRREYIRLKELDSLLLTEDWAPVEPNRSIAASSAVVPKKHSLGRWTWIALVAVAAGLCFTLFTWYQASPRIYRPMELSGLSPIGVVKSADSRATADGSLSVGMDLKPGVITIDQGSLTLAFNVGAEIALTGPAELHLLSDQEATLLRGDANVEVRHKNGRFVLNSPFSSHIETRSSYSLSVSAVDSLVTVYGGELVVSRLGDKGYTYTSVTLKSTQRMRASAESLELLEPTGGVPKNLSMDRSSGPSLLVTPEYVQAVKEDRPSLYWRFEGDDSSALVDAMGNPQKMAKIVSAKSPSAVKLTGSSLLFESSDSPRLVQLDSTLDNILNDEFTIELLVKPANGSWQSIISLVAEKSASDVDHYLLMEFADESYMVHPRNSFRFLYRNPAGKAQGINLFSGGGQPSGSWHHLAATKDGDSVRFFHNGVLVGASGVPSHWNQDKLLLYLGQLRFSDNDRAYCGEVDELAIYTYSLSASQIARHFSLLHSKAAPLGNYLSMNQSSSQVVKLFR